MMGDMPARYDVIGLDADDTLWHSEDTFHQVEARFVELVAPYASIGVDVAAALRATERAQLPIAGYGVKAVHAVDGPGGDHGVRGPGPGARHRPARSSSAWTC